MRGGELHTVLQCRPSACHQAPTCWRPHLGWGLSQSVFKYKWCAHHPPPSRPSTCTHCVAPSTPLTPHLHVGLACVVQVAAPALPAAAHAEGLLELVLTLSHTRIVKGQLLTRSNLADGVQRYSQTTTSRHNNSLEGGLRGADRARTGRQQKHSRTQSQTHRYGLVRVHKHVCVGAVVDWLRSACRGQ